MQKQPRLSQAGGIAHLVISPSGCYLYTSHSSGDLDRNVSFYNVMNLSLLTNPVRFCGGEGIGQAWSRRPNLLQRS